ncbi:DNA-binding protein SMUBP-2 [Picochlorum sp. SENEW3]|nr:DNA-binding protein SMUBP-2 [Picochlorum sp. SENEW3]
MREANGRDVGSDEEEEKKKKKKDEAGLEKGRHTLRREREEDFVARMHRLITLEHEAEKAEAEDMLAKTDATVAQRKGVVLLNVRVEDVESGLLGKTLLTLARSAKGSAQENVLPAHTLSQHDIVRIKPNKSDGSRAGFVFEGVVYRIRDASITVAVDVLPDDDDSFLCIPLKVEKLANYVTYRRLSSTLDTISKVGHACRIKEIVFEGKKPEYDVRQQGEGQQSSFGWTPINTHLDQSQKDAVTKALSSRDVVLIHGPPGTGKTTTLVEYIAQEVKRGCRVLACAGSNIAVDNIVEGLGKLDLNVVRIGHPARMLPQILEQSLDYKVLHSDESGLARDCRQEIQQLNRKLLKLSGRDRQTRKQIRQEIRYLNKEEKRRQQTAVDRCLASAHVVCCTLSGAASRHVSELPIFDVVVIDEAAQAIEPSCWSALIRGKRCVLGGDHLQLTPTILSDKASKQGLSVTLFERLRKIWGDHITQTLLIQYRMNEKIMKWSSVELYDDRIQAHASVAHRILDEPLVHESFPVLAFIDTAGCDMEETKEEDGESLKNTGEADIVMAYIEKLIAAGMRPADIGVITPYAAQVTLLRSMRSADIGSKLEISTVDGFQGREKEAIVISMVRSNSSGEVGFLSDSRRMNVAVTRAKRHCVIIGDSETISKNAFLDRLVTYFQEHGEYDTAETFRLA